MRKEARESRVEGIKKVIVRSPYLPDSRVAEICGCSHEMVFNVRGREFGLAGMKGQGFHGDAAIMFSLEEMERLDTWLKQEGLLEEGEG